jgi:hypothetical protein
MDHVVPYSFMLVTTSLFAVVTYYPMCMSIPTLLQGKENGNLIFTVYRGPWPMNLFHKLFEYKNLKTPRKYQFTYNSLYLKFKFKNSYIFI